MIIQQQANPTGIIFTSTAGYQTPIQPPPYSAPGIAPSCSTHENAAPQYTIVSGEQYFQQKQPHPQGNQAT